jgi:hypothetical protein
MTAILLAFLAATVGDDTAIQVTYPPSTEPGRLQLGVTYTLWVPGGVERIRGVIVHQHGCGSGACKGGATAAYDLHWQSLARKWDCALLGPSYQQDDKQDCKLWCDPRNGSDQTFLKALGELAAKSGHPEIEKAPWCLWGHSGGGTWASLMQTLHPDRVVAAWLRSGTAFSAWEKGTLPAPKLSEAVYAIPVMCNPGAKEKGDKRFDGAWTGTFAMFNAYRAKGAPIGFAPDPRTSHECGDSRYLAIPFFDACLAMRLPEPGSTALRPVDWKSAWLAAPLSESAAPASSTSAKAEEAVWLPNERVAKAWEEYVKTGAVTDTTVPPAPRAVRFAAKPDGTIELTWQADADFESGLKAFVIQRDGKDLAQFPEKPVGKFGRPLFQPMSYHDTPEAPMPDLRFVDRSPTPGAKHEYRVVSVNGVGLRSEPSQPASQP